jgi:4-amino-4-deoxy-L-arabinose transferase-like glycosyltransferase
VSIDEDAQSAARVAPATGAPSLPPFAWRPVLAVTGLLIVALAATTGRYGFHRDELYFRVLGQHPAWGYVDQPPLTPLLVRTATALFGDSLWSLRLPAILLVPATLPLVALLARELGGGRGAQLLAALGACGTYVLVAGHLVLTSSLDIPATALVLLLVIRALRRDEPRWWLWAGLATGLSLYNKELLPLLFAGLAAGLLIAGPRRVLRSPWPWAGVAIALLVGLPNLVYQATHGFPQLDMARALSDHKGADNRASFLPLQLLLFGLPVVPVWVAGWVGLFRQPAWRRLRAFAWAYPLVGLFVLVTGSGPYYPFGLMLPLLAAGAVATVRWVAGRRWRWALASTAVGLSVALGVVLALPLVPAGSLRGTPIPQILQPVRDQLGWPTYVRQVADVYDRLPPADRAHAVILAGNYGEYGALTFYGPDHALPSVYSGQNELRRYGPPPASATVVVAVGFDDPDGALRPSFATCQSAGALDSGLGIDSEEQGRVIWLCREPVAPWSQLWERFQHFD